jgi:hypothetical protein
MKSAVKVSTRPDGVRAGGKIIEVTGFKKAYPQAPLTAHSGALISVAFDDDGVLVVDVYRPDGNVEVRCVTPEYQEARRENATVEIKARISRVKA